MAITELRAFLRDGLTIAVCKSDLVDPDYYWYLDGLYLARTTEPRFSIYLSAGDQARLDVLDSTDPNFDPIANTPESYPGRFVLSWARSVGEPVDRYVIRQTKQGSAARDVATIRTISDRWLYEWRSPRLDDLGVYTFQVIPFDRAGNQGTAVDLMSLEKIVRRPDAPRFSIEFDAGSGTVIISDAL